MLASIVISIKNDPMILFHMSALMFFCTTVSFGCGTRNVLLNEGDDPSTGTAPTHFDNRKEEVEKYNRQDQIGEQVHRKSWKRSNAANATVASIVRGAELSIAEYTGIDGHCPVTDENYGKT
jgi:hypothetical protein